MYRWQSVLAVVRQQALVWRTPSEKPPVQVGGVSMTMQLHVVNVYNNWLAIAQICESFYESTAVPEEVW